MPAALFLILAATLYRLLPPWLHVDHDWMQNFSPLASLVLCGSVFFSKRTASWVPLTILFVSDVILNAFVYSAPLMSWEILPRYAVFAGICLLAFRNRTILQKNLPALLGSSICASVIFYLATNTASWAGEPGYAKNLAGWWQSLTVGLPGFPPTSQFFRNSVTSDLLFTTIFWGSMVVSVKKLSPVREPWAKSLATSEN